MAAGMGSRYGGNKQVDGFGPNGELIMEYSIFDAIRAGFKKVVLIVRPELHEEVLELLGPKLENKIELSLVHQTLDTLVPQGLRNPARKKPYGTAHAVLCAKEEIPGSFSVINADDFYGKEGFKAISEFLDKDHNSNHCLAGYRLSQVLSENGSVSRAICQVDVDNNLKEIKETHNIYEENGQIWYEENGSKKELKSNERISMNLWGFRKDFFDYAEVKFEQFLKTRFEDVKAELYIANVVDQIILEGKSKVKVLPTEGIWTGVTYPEDKQIVINKLKQLVDKKEYPQKLW